ncbi:acyltransferase [Pseudovibrio japonicus]|uniref:Acyltransferase n=1 Tax=Pseudovibrio japonicus TaxID=366534 RepID=A0ABQ3ETK0_9HYPH|nr:acyltransferase [Pseudovibrio japonicus]
MGVDLFFVISGFLMTQIILSSQFGWSIPSLKQFYSKRFWRIAPAYLFAVAIASLVALSNQWALIIDKFTQSLLSSLAFSYNVYAPLETGYFAAAAITKPFLHLWSLGVEVQFYLLWPVLLFFIYKRPFRQQVLAIAAITTISLIYAVISQLDGDEDAYFRLTARLWQFGAGGLIALALKRTPAESNSRLFSYIGIASLLLILLLSYASPWEDWNVVSATLITVAGASLIYIGGRQNVISSRVLSVKPIRTLGLVSYSVYLIHWPLAVGLYFYFPDFETDSSIRIGGAILSVVLGALLYWAVEKKFRLQKGQVQPAAKKWLTASTFGVLLVFAVGLQSERLWPLVFDSRLIELSALDRDFREYGGESCNGDPKVFCVLGDQIKAPELVLWGDSHARHFALGIDRVFTEQNRNAVSFATSGCAPTGNWANQRASNFANCKAANQAVMAYLASEQSPHRVLLAARWFKFTPGVNSFSDFNNPASPARDIEGVLDQTFSELKALGKQVTIALQAPEYRGKGQLRTCQDAFIKNDGSMRIACDRPATDHLKRQREMDRLLIGVASRYDNVEVADVKSVFCDSEGCLLAQSDKFYYRDTNHLNRIGAEKVVREAFIGM